MWILYMEISKGIGSCIKNVYEKNRINFKYILLNIGDKCKLILKNK